MDSRSNILKLLQQQLQEKSQNKIAKELKISASALSQIMANKYPNPENAGKVVYKDESENCFKFKAEEIKCPSDKSKIKDVTDNDD